MTQNVIHLTRRPSTATPANTPHDLATLEAYQQAENGLVMALHYLRSSATNIPGATRKAVQALGALNRLNKPSNTPAPAGAGARALASLEG